MSKGSKSKKNKRKKANKKNIAKQSNIQAKKRETPPKAKISETKAKIKTESSQTKNEAVKSLKTEAGKAKTEAVKKTKATDKEPPKEQKKSRKKFKILLPAACAALVFISFAGHKMVTEGKQAKLEEEQELVKTEEKSRISRQLQPLALIEDEISRQKKMKEQRREQEQAKRQAKIKEEQEKKERAKQIYKNNPDILMLVNKKREFVKDAYDAQLQAFGRKGVIVNSRIYADLQRMLQDASDAGHVVWVVSAYRSREYQQQLLDRRVKERMRSGMSEQEALERSLRTVMPAGHSEHETGLVVDIACSEFTQLEPEMENTLANTWLRQHCAEYGFIVRYPKNKESITQVSYEPWHFRYVGAEAAAFLTKEGLTLEEFYEWMED